MNNEFTVLSVPSNETYEWLLLKHYAKRIPSISWAFGLYDSSMTLQGVCTFGTPVSSTLLKGVCGCRNLASFFISRCVAMLPRPKIIVSYADSSKGHHGFVYQATNFIYTGLSTLTYDPVVKGHEGKHHGTAGMGRGMTKDQMKEKYGDDVYWRPRDRKHRYILFHGDRREKREMRKDLRYVAQDFPKGDNQKYDAAYQPDTQGILFQ